MLRSVKTLRRWWQIAHAVIVAVWTSRKAARTPLPTFTQSEQRVFKRQLYRHSVTTLMHIWRRPFVLSSILLSGMKVGWLRKWESWVFLRRPTIFLLFWSNQIKLHRNPTLMMILSIRARRRSKAGWSRWCLLQCTTVCEIFISERTER